MLPSPEGFSGKQYAILALGNPIVDITVEMDEEQVLALGLTVGVDAPPLDDAERQKIIDFCAASPTVAYTPGGAALNTIRVSQSYLNHPEATAYIGAVGSDDLAKVIVDGCDRCGVKTVLQSVDEATGALHLEIENGRSVQRAGTSLSGTCAALICNKDRALAGLPGAARRLSHDFVKANEHLVAASAIVYIDTFALVSPPRVATAMWLAGKTCEYGGRLALNLQSANLLKFNKNARDAIAAMLPLATYIFGNAQELEAYADLQGWEVGSGEGLSLAEKLAAQLGTAHAPAIATITAGGGPTILAVSCTSLPSALGINCRFLWHHH